MLVEGLPENYNDAPSGLLSTLTSNSILIFNYVHADKNLVWTKDAIIFDFDLYISQTKNKIFCFFF